MKFNFAIKAWAMALICTFIGLEAPLAGPRQIIILEVRKNEFRELKWQHHILETLTTKFHIPREFIRLKIGPCRSSNQRAILHLCVDSKVEGNFRILWADQQTLKTSFAAFAKLYKQEK